MAIKVAIVDDKFINRQTVKDKIVSYKEVEIILEAKNGIDFLEQLKAAKSLPDLVLMDLEMPEMNGIDAIKIASASYPSLKFIVLTVFEDNDKIFDAIQAGAGGYLLKEDNALSIIDAITNVIEFNGTPMSPSIARKVMDIVRNANNKTATEESKNENEFLSDRELEILKELVSGKNYKSIGEKLFISPLTVRKHVSNIYDKLHINSRAQAINIAYKNKWI